MKDTTFRNALWNVDALEGSSELPDEVIDCVITSPPYWSLRDYGIDPTIWDAVEGCEHEFEVEIIHHDNLRFRDPNHISTVGNDKNEERFNTPKTESGFCIHCGAWKGCLGLEPTFTLFIKHLCDVFEALKPKLKKSGTLWVNLGDTYHNSDKWSCKKELPQTIAKGNNRDYTPKRIPNQSLPQKCLCSIPDRFAIEMTDKYGWILRNRIIWYKPNCMPSSARDRFTVDFEMVYMFVKSKKYYFDQDAVRENLSEQRQKQAGQLINPNNIKGKKARKEKGKMACGNHFDGHNWLMNPKGRNKRCVWEIPTSPNPEAHFATFPPALVKPMIKAGCPRYVCSVCGKPREKIIEREKAPKEVFTKKNTPNDCFTGSSVEGKMMGQGGKLQAWRDKHPDKLKGYTSCGCNAKYDNGIVLDPFAGSGTTLYTAWKLGRDYLGFEISKEYCKIAEKQLSKTNIVRLDKWVG